MSDLTEIERGVLALASDYGVDLDLSGPRVRRTIKAAARELLRKGHLTGTIKALSITIKGDAELHADR